MRNVIYIHLIANQTKKGKKKKKEDYTLIYFYMIFKKNM